MRTIKSCLNKQVEKIALNPLFGDFFFFLPLAKKEPWFMSFPEGLIIIPEKTALKIDTNKIAPDPN